jgi:hypothetical protein
MSKIERKIGFDKAALEQKILEDTEDYLVMPAVLAREMVQPYPEGKAYKPADELEKSAWTGEGRWVAILKHPDTGLLMNRNDVKGRIENTRFAKDILDPKTKRPMVRGIRGDIRWFKKLMPPTLIDDIKSNKIRDVSIGFTYDEDRTPGEFEGEKYDFAQRNIFIDHVVAPCEVGRCPSPFCGIGVDSVLKNDADRLFKIGLDPWEETEEYIRSGHRDPGSFDPDSLRTIDITGGVKAIVGCPKGSYEGGKCKVGMQVQSYLFDKSKFTVAEAKTWFESHKGDTPDNCEKCDEKTAVTSTAESSKVTGTTETKTTTSSTQTPAQTQTLTSDLDNIIEKTEDVLEVFKKLREKSAVF